MRAYRGYALISMPIISTECALKRKYSIWWGRCIYPSVRGYVIDAKTDEPIEDATILCTWIQTRGIPGMVSEYGYKAYETTEKRKDFHWENGFIASLEEWKEG